MACAYTGSMVPDASKSPFQPGTGTSPPVLAGREDEKATLKALLEHLANGELKQSIYLMQASRGMGKTVLLRDLEVSARSDVAVIFAPAAELLNLAEVAQFIAPKLSWWRAIPNLFASLTVAGVKITAPKTAPVSELQAIRKALDAAVAESLGYPYFLQLWGKALWENGCARKTVDNAVLEEARRQVEAVRTEFYAARFDEFERDAREAELDRNVMLKAAQLLAAQVATPDAALTTGELNRFLDDAGLESEDAVVAKRIIVDNGFLTRAGDEWRPAIPSLAAYMRDHPRLA